MNFVPGRKVSFNSQTKVNSRILLLKRVVNKFLTLQVFLLNCLNREQTYIIDISEYVHSHIYLTIG